ncbi:predicted protein [Streptomyces sp. C]|nr:predicted protein [Streptomyces sp. C]
MTLVPGGGGAAVLGDASPMRKNALTAQPVALMRSPTCSKSVGVLARLPIITLQLHLLGEIRRVADEVSTYRFRSRVRL